MGNVIGLSEFRKEARFKVKTCPIFNGKDIYDAILIVLENTNTGEIVDIPKLNAFFLSKNIIRLNRNTRAKYAQDIKMFLNSIHFEREHYERSEIQLIETGISILSNKQNLGKIEELTIKDVDIFLNDYKYGKVGAGKEKRRSSIEHIEKSLVAFCYFLACNKNFHMKYINRGEFVSDVYNTDAYSSKKRWYDIAPSSPFTIIYPPKHERKRLEYISFYALAEFITLSLEYCPMITLGIALQAFAGLRRGEVTNATFNNINWYYIGNKLRDFRIDLTEKSSQLRSDNVDVGQIKSKAIAYVHPAFLDFFSLIFEEHRRYLKEDFIKQNKHGALFINRDGNAMTDRNYEYAFNNIANLLIARLLESGNAESRNEANRMIEFSFTTHTLRFFFTQYIARLPDANIFDIAMFRRDRSLTSALRYIRSNPYVFDEKIKAIQKKNMKDIGLY